LLAAVSPLALACLAASSPLDEIRRRHLMGTTTSRRPAHGGFTGLPPTRAAHDQAGTEDDPLAARGATVDALQHDPGSRRPDLSAWLIDGRERHTSIVRRCQVVEADNPEVVGHAQANLAGGVEHLERHRVVDGEDAIWPGACRQVLA